MDPNKYYQSTGLHSEISNGADGSANHNPVWMPDAVPGDGVTTSSFILPRRQFPSNSPPYISNYPPVSETTDWYDRYNQRDQPMTASHYEVVDTDESMEESPEQQIKAPTPRRGKKPISSTNMVSKNPGKLAYGGDEKRKRQKQRHKATQLNKVGDLNNLIHTITGGGAGDVVEQAMKDCGIEDEAVVDHVLGKLSEYLAGKRNAAIIASKSKK